MSLLVRALIAGFGYKIGAELGRVAAKRLGLQDDAKADADDDGVPPKVAQPESADGDDGDQD